MKRDYKEAIMMVAGTLVCAGVIAACILFPLAIRDNAHDHDTERTATTVVVTLPDTRKVTCIVSTTTKSGGQYNDLSCDWMHVTGSDWDGGNE